MQGHQHTPAFPLTSEPPVLFSVGELYGSAIDATRPAHGDAAAGNRAGQAFAFVVLLLWLILVGLALCHLSGCTPAQESGAGADLTKASAELGAASTALVGSATTRPSPLVTVVDAAAPVAAPYITLGGYVLAGTSAAAAAMGTWLSSKATIASLAETGTTLAASLADHRSALAEAVGDIAEYRQPTVPWTHTTAKLIADVAGMAAAAPESATTITSLDVKPSPITATLTAPS